MLKKVYIFILLCAFAVGVVIFDFFPRSSYSELEKRDLSRFPEFSVEALLSGSYTSSLSSWFSDTEPFRDEFMLASMTFKNLIAYSSSEEEVRFYANENTVEDDSEPIYEDMNSIQSAHDETSVNEHAKIADAGIIIVGKRGKVRALMAYGGSSNGGDMYANVVNDYKQQFPHINVYCMVVPTSSEFYCPEKARKCTRSQLATIKHIYGLLQDVHPVNVYTPLANHLDEEIYLRTDHHWAPLGGYYAAQKFAEIARVPFLELSNYDKRVVHNFVGSMYGYSKDISIKQSPEDFVYYTPRNVSYTTTYTDYYLDESFKIIGMSKPHKGSYFKKFRDGSGAAYTTFMGGDAKITQIKTHVANGRRLIVFKDSYGNTIPGYLLASFEEIHVIDFRYFIQNIRDYVSLHNITDILFVNNIYNAYGKSCARAYHSFLMGANIKSFVPGVYVKPKEKTRKVKDTISIQEPQPSDSPLPSSSEPQPTSTLESDEIILEE